MVKLCTFVFLLQLIQRRQSFKLLSTDTPIKLASSSWSERAKQITSPSRSLVGMDLCVNYIHVASLKQIPLQNWLFRLNWSCYSYLGRIGGAQELSLGNGCWSTGIVQHEFMHALGFVHEQSRPDRDDYVTVDFTNILSGNLYNKEKTYFFLEEVVTTSKS